MYRLVVYLCSKWTVHCTYVYSIVARFLPPCLSCWSAQWPAQIAKFIAHIQERIVCLFVAAGRPDDASAAFLERPVILDFIYHRLTNNLPTKSPCPTGKSSIWLTWHCWATTTTWTRCTDSPPVSGSWRWTGTTTSASSLSSYWPMVRNDIRIEPFVPISHQYVGSVSGTKDLSK